MVFLWSLSDSKSPQVSRTLLSILAVFNNAVVWMVSTRPPTSKSSRPLNNPSVTVPKAPITIFAYHMINSFYYYYHCYYYYFTLLRVFHTSVSRWFLIGVWVTASLIKSPELSIPDDLNNALVWIVSTLPPFSNFSSPFTNFLVTVPSAPITMSITVTFMFNCFFSSLARSRYLSSSCSIVLLVLLQSPFIHLPFRFLSFLLYDLPWRQSPQFGKFSFFVLLTIIGSGRLAEIRWFVCISKSHRILCISFSETDSGLCIHHLFAWSNFNFWHNFH